MDTATARTYRTPAYQVRLVRDSSVPTNSRPAVSSPASVVELVRAYLGETDREHFILIMVDVKNRPIGIHTVATGSLDRCIVSIANVVKPLLLANAAGAILAHNHPSGDPQPSSDDKRLTRSIAEAFKLFEIRLIDHIIVGDGTTEHFSFIENSLLG